MSDEMPGRDLTEEERRVIRWLPTPLSFADIGDRLDMPGPAVKATAVRLYRILGIASRREAVETLVRLGLLAVAQPDAEDLHSSLEDLDEAFFRMGAVRDAAGRIVDFEYQFCNRAALAVLGRPREAVIGRRLLALFPSHMTDGLFEAYVQVVETGEPLRYEFSFDDGGVVGDFEVVVSRHGDGYVLAGHDISVRKRRERDLVQVRNQLETVLTSQTVIEQAKGYAAALTGTDPETAFHAIRQHAHDHNQRLTEVARSIVTGDIALDNEIEGTG